MLVHHARWSDLDPGTHPLDLDRLRAPVSAIVHEAARAASVDREAIVQRIDRLLLLEHGVWITGWRWAASEPGGGGPGVAGLDGTCLWPGASVTPTAHLFKCRGGRRCHW